MRLPRTILVAAVVSITIAGCKRDRSHVLSVTSCMTPASCLSWTVRDGQSAILRKGCDDQGGRWFDGACPRERSLGGCRDKDAEPTQQWFYPGGGDEAVSKNGFPRSVDDVKLYCADNGKLFVSAN